MFDPIQQDKNDPLAHFRKKFLIPQKNGKEQIYFLGNSLGLQPASLSSSISEVLTQWSQFGVEGFFTGDDPWIKYHDKLTTPLSYIVGALTHEIVVMNHLTVNLHLLLASFYRPDNKRFKIICEANAFPSDQYMLESQVKSHGFDPAEAIIEVHPKTGETIITNDDIRVAIEKHASQLSLVLWGGVNYYTGQLFDISSITAMAHEAGAIAGFDLAHAIGNVKLDLHNHEVDFACWCSYKYLNSGPGGIAGAYIHERYHADATVPRLAGWWGYEDNTRFKMMKGFRPIKTAEGWQVSTPPIILMAMHKASLDIFMEAGMDNLLKKGKMLSDYLIFLINEINDDSGKHLMKILTPSSRGCQLSLVIKHNASNVFEQLMQNGIFADWREPDVIRVAPVPLYNTFTEVYKFSQVLKKLTA
ncbi:MAG TPA: kynureninase [Flavitalea sp.]|nr:kynureninase [Flavitalea sp.]